MSTLKPLYTPESVDEALLILDEALNLPSHREDELYMLVDMAAQKLRPVPAPEHDAEALEQLAKKYPLELPWMKCDSSCLVPKDGCSMCEEGGEAND